MKIILFLLILILVVFNISVIYNIEEEIIPLPTCLQTAFTQGDSMYPMIKNGDEIIINECFNFSEVKINTIVVFRDFSKTEGAVGYYTSRVLHRTVDIDFFHKYILTKGDNNEYFDYWRPIKFVEGIYVGSVIRLE